MFTIQKGVHIVHYQTLISRRSGRRLTANSIHFGLWAPQFKICMGRQLLNEKHQHWWQQPKVAIYLTISFLRSRKGYAAFMMSMQSAFSVIFYRLSVIAVFSSAVRSNIPLKSKISPSASLSVSRVWYQSTTETMYLSSSIVSITLTNLFSYTRWSLIGPLSLARFGPFISHEVFGYQIMQKKNHHLAILACSVSYLCPKQCL